MDPEVTKALVKYRELVAAEAHYHATRDELSWAFAELTPDQRGAYIRAVHVMEEEDRAEAGRTA